MGDQLSLIMVLNEEIIEYTSLYCEWYLKNR
jgi:hypothetical protein